MPVQFLCSQCGTRLQVSSKKLGKQITCPRCEASVAVPGADSAGQTGTGVATDSGLQDIGLTETAELVAEGPSRRAPIALRLSAPPRNLAIPFRMLYIQAMLIFVLAVLSFTVGYLAGSRRTNPKENNPTETGDFDRDGLAAERDSR